MRPESGMKQASKTRKENDMATWRGLTTMADVMDDPSVRNLTKDVLRLAETKDALDAYRDVQLAADILQARFAALGGR